MISFELLEYYSASYACYIFLLQIRGVFLLTNICNSLKDCMQYASHKTVIFVLLILSVQVIDLYPTCFLGSTPFPFRLIPLMTVHCSAKYYVRFNIGPTLCTPLKKNSFPHSVHRMDQFLKFRCKILWQWRLGGDSALNKILSYSFSLGFHRLVHV
jgi:hypothetical protein